MVGGEPFGQAVVGQLRINGTKQFLAWCGMTENSRGDCMFTCLCTVPPTNLSKQLFNYLHYKLSSLSQHLLNKKCSTRGNRLSSTSLEKALGSHDILWLSLVRQLLETVLYFRDLF